MLREGGVADVRVKRTDKLLLEALIELTGQKGFAAVTVSDLTRYAGINRATFYRHYEDKFDLLNHYARTVYELLDSMPDAEVRDEGTEAGSKLDKAQELGVAIWDEQRLLEFLRESGQRD